MNVTKRFEVPVVFTIIPLEDDAKRLMDEPIEDTIVLSIVCEKLDYPEDCEKLDEVITRSGQFVGLYSAVVEAIADQYGINTEQVNLIEDPIECMDLEE